jgi:hypothetical protein
MDLSFEPRCVMGTVASSVCNRQVLTTCERERRRPRDHGEEENHGRKRLVGDRRDDTLVHLRSSDQDATEMDEDDNQVRNTRGFAIDAICVEILNAFRFCRT